MEKAGFSRGKIAIRPAFGLATASIHFQPLPEADGTLDDEAKGNLSVSVDAVKELLVACKAIDGSLN